jgi:hypothetical protein
MKRSAILTLGLLTTLVVGKTALADDPQKLPGWTPIPFSDFTLPGVCPFTIVVKILENDAIGATTKTFPDGSPQEQIFMGPQRLRLSNADTGKSVVTFLDGIEIFDYGSDGSLLLTDIGKNIVTFFPGDPFGAGFYFVDGYHQVYYAPNGAAREMRSAIGVEKNYCQILAGPKERD